MTYGWYLYPGKETDQNYGRFKSQFQWNLAAVSEEQIEQDSVSLQPWLVGLIVFGGTDPVTGFELTDCAFWAGFSKKACLNAWAKVGAAPLSTN